ncbi:MAG: sugar phosphate isomerase/epimerase family protein [Terriglobia bacterium]
MSATDFRFQFACAPVSWGVQDDPGPGWEQPYEQVLSEIAAAGYTGTELGPYGYFPVDPQVLAPKLDQFRLTLLSSFVPVPLAGAAQSKTVVDHVRTVGALLAALKAPLLVLADRQTPVRQQLAGRVPLDGTQSLRPQQWREAGRMIEEVEKAVSDFGLKLVFHPHAGTYVETPWEVERLFDSLHSSRVGLCLDTGHCIYGGGDPVDEARKYRGLLQYLHLKDINANKLAEARQTKLAFNQAVGIGVFAQIGEGCIGFAEFFREVAAAQYSGWAVVEQDVIYGNAALPPRERMRASLQYLQKMLADQGIANR